MFWSISLLFIIPFWWYMVVLALMLLRTASGVVCFCLALEFVLWEISWRFRKAEIVLSKQVFKKSQNVCTRFDPGEGRWPSSTEGNTVASLIFTQSFSNLFCRSGVWFPEYDKTSDLKVYLAISALCWAYFGILWMHCSFISQNLWCYKRSIIWKTSASESKASSIGQVIPWYYLETPHLWLGTEEIMCTPKSFDLNVASVSFSVESQWIFAANPDSHVHLLLERGVWRGSLQFPWSRRTLCCPSLWRADHSQLWNRTTPKGRKIGKLSTARAACVIHSRGHCLMLRPFFFCSNMQ